MIKKILNYIEATSSASNPNQNYDVLNFKLHANAAYGKITYALYNKNCGIIHNFNDSKGEQ